MSGSSPVDETPIRTLKTPSMTFGYLSWGSGPQKVLALHGFPDTPYSMNKVAQILAQSGYHVIAPFLRGYSPTSLAPDGRYDIAALCDDVIQILDTLDWPQAHIIGHDWGAIIAYAVGAQHPERCAGLTALSVPPFKAFRRAFFRSHTQRRQSVYMLWFQLTGIAEAILRRNHFKAIDGLWSAWSPGWEVPSDYTNRVKDCFSQTGSLSAALEYYRQARPGVSKRLRDAQKLLLTAPRCPVVCAIGENDHCVDPRAFSKLNWPVRLITHAGHFLPLEAPEAIAQLVREG